jgi:IclR family KDG regulon transcriptional repressor
VSEGDQEKQRGTVQSVERALSIVEILAEAGRSLMLKELSERIGLPQSTVYRLLGVLVSRGYVCKDLDTKQYSLGVRILEISGGFQIASVLRAKGGRFTRALADSVGETVNVAVLDGFECIVVDRVESRHTLRYAVRFGARGLLHCTGAGKVLLAHMPDGEIEAFIQRGLPSVTPNTIVDRYLLMKELERVRAKGYAVDNEEHELGIRCIAAPILDRSGVVIASVSISGPTKRITPHCLGDLSRHVKETALAVSHALGYKDPLTPRSEPVDRFYTGNGIIFSTTAARGTDPT